MCARVFTDGSLLDGNLGVNCPAVGWAFVALDDEDRVVAAAFGVPPRWVDTIQGAELWAIQMALSSVSFAGAVYTDCKTVQVGIGRGTGWVHNAKRRYARIWAVIHSSLDDGDRCHIIKWMPAHTSKASVGSARCSNGKTLTKVMRLANQMADSLAKEAAATVRVSELFRREAKENFGRAVELAVFVGQLTHEASAHKTADGRVIRDSEACDQQRQVARRQRGEAKSESVGAVGLDTSVAGLYTRSSKLAQLRQRILGEVP